MRPKFEQICVTAMIVFHMYSAAAFPLYSHFVVLIQLCVYTICCKLLSFKIEKVKFKL